MRETAYWFVVPRHHWQYYQAESLTYSSRGQSDEAQRRSAAPGKRLLMLGTL